MEIYYCNINDFPDLESIQLLNFDRQEQIKNSRQPEDKVRSLVAGLMMRKSLGDSAYKNIIKGPHGKPMLPENWEHSSFFNISHSGDYVVLAQSPTNIGIDIEVIKETPPKHVGKRCFTADELTWLTSQETDGIADTPETGFYKLWSGKESVMKAYGLGFHMPPNSFEVLPIKDGPHKIKKQTWYLYWSYLERHQICICCESTQESIELIPWTLKDLL